MSIQRWSGLGGSVLMDLTVATALQSSVNRKREEILDETAEQILRLQQQLVPVVTGQLQSSLGITKGPGVRIVGAAFARAPYAAQVEFGGPRNTARPYITPSAELARRDFLARIPRILLP